MTCDVETCGKEAVRAGLCIGHAFCFNLRPLGESRSAFLVRQAKQARDMGVRVALARTLHSAGD